jgi:hypothetical protein
LAGRIDGVALGAIGAGAVFIYAGLKGVSVLKALQNIVRGQAPPAGSSSASPAGLSTFLGIPGVTAAGLPRSGAFTPTQLQQLWISNGGDPTRAANAACHAMQESSGIATSTSRNPDGGINVGLWQLDTRGKGAGYTIAQLQDPATNARVTIMGTNNGRDWSAWATPGC